MIWNRYKHVNILTNGIHKILECKLKLHKSSLDASVGALDLRCMSRISVHSLLRPFSPVTELPGKETLVELASPPPRGVASADDVLDRAGLVSRSGKRRGRGVGVTAPTPAPLREMLEKTPLLPAILAGRNGRLVDSLGVFAGCTLSASVTSSSVTTTTSLAKASRRPPLDDRVAGALACEAESSKAI